jgi:hypothetical protein
LTGQEYTQLISYIAHSAPATRRPGTGREPYLRPEVGFIPKWYRQRLSIDFGRRWHTDPEYRSNTIAAMTRETSRRFGGRCDIGVMQRPDGPVDVLTGTFGALLVAGIYGIPIRYNDDDWPWGEVGGLSDDDVEALEPPSLDENPFWDQFTGQLDWIEANCGEIRGFMNWQGVLNNSYRLRGNKIFTDMIRAPERVQQVFDCVTETMIDGAKRLYERQQASGVDLDHYTISNCLVNMLSPRQYADLQLPFDLRIAKAFRIIGVHNCAWDATPYLHAYSTLPGVAYIDMGMESDLAAAKELFPAGRRAIMYPPRDLETKTVGAIRDDFERIASQYGPCDMVLADITEHMTDARVHAILDICESISDRYSEK